MDFDEIQKLAAKGTPVKISYGLEPGDKNVEGMFLPTNSLPRVSFGGVRTGRQCFFERKDTGLKVMLIPEQVVLVEN